MRRRASAAPPARPSPRRPRERRARGPHAPSLRPRRRGRTRRPAAGRAVGACRRSGRRPGWRPPPTAGWSSSESLGDGGQDRALDVLLVGGGEDGLVLVDPEDALAVEHSALDGDRGAVVARGLHVERQAMAPALGVDAIVRAVDAARVGADHADRSVLLVDVPAELFEHRLRDRPDAVGGRIERLSHRPAGRRGGSQRQHEQQRARQDLHGSLLYIPRRGAFTGFRRPTVGESSRLAPFTGFRRPTVGESSRLAPFTGFRRPTVGPSSTASRPLANDPWCIRPRSWVYTASAPWPALTLLITTVTL